MRLCKGQCCRHCHKTYKQILGFMYGLMVVVERLGHVGIFTHTAGKSNTKEDLPRKFLLPQKVQHNLTDFINLCCDPSGPACYWTDHTPTLLTPPPSVKRLTRPTQQYQVPSEPTIRLLKPQHLYGIWSGLTPYKLPLDTLSEYPEP